MNETETEPHVLIQQLIQSAAHYNNSYIWILLAS